MIRSLIRAGHRHRCAALDVNGKRCHARRHLKLTNYHGDHEIYDYQGPEPTWVKVHLCPAHRKKEKR